MNRIVGIAVLAIGIVLLIWGFAANDSAGSGISRFFTGSPTNKTIVLLVGGALLSAVGIGSLFYRGRNNPV